MRFLPSLLLTSVCLLASSRLLGVLSPPPAAADSLTFTTFPDVILRHLLNFAPYLLGICLVLFVFVFMFGEAYTTNHAPLTDKARASGDLLDLRRALRGMREWLSQQHLPAVTGPLTESIATLCAEIDRQLEGRERDAVATPVTTLRKLLTVELATLMLHYQRVPRALRLLPYLNTSANDLIVNGLRSVDDQLRSVHQGLATNDLRDLHVQTRYLELKSEDESHLHTFTPAPVATMGVVSPRDAATRIDMPAPASPILRSFQTTAPLRRSAHAPSVRA